MIVGGVPSSPYFDEEDERVGSNSSGGIPVHMYLTPNNMNASCATTGGDIISCQRFESITYINFNAASSFILLTCSAALVMHISFCSGNPSVIGLAEQIDTVPMTRGTGGLPTSRF